MEQTVEKKINVSSHSYNAEYTTVIALQKGFYE